MSSNHSSIEASIKTQMSSNFGSISLEKLRAKGAELSEQKATLQTQIAESKVASCQARVESVQGELSPPPTTIVPDGKGSKTVVDQREVARLNKELAQEQAKLSSARSDLQAHVGDTTVAKDEQTSANTAVAAAETENQSLGAKLDAEQTVKSPTGDSKSTQAVAKTDNDQDKQGT